MIKIRYEVLIPVACLLILGLSGCSYIQKRMDISALAELAGDISPDVHTGSPEILQAFIRPLSLQRDTAPASDIRFAISPLKKWPMNSPRNDQLIMEEISFPSLVSRENGKDRAVFYIYRTGQLKDKKVILWIPGAAVSDFAFHFIKNFFQEELARNYSIVFYVPPYHMERAKPGKDNGAGLFTSSPEWNISVLLNAVRELRTMMAYLRSNGVATIGGWGGSIGATILLLAEQTEAFDHLNIMIPVIDLETVVLRNDHMREVAARFEKAGFSERILREAYGVVNPVNYKLKMDPNRVEIQYAEYDQLTPAGATLKYAEQNHIKKVMAYPRSHATILLSCRLYEDYGLFLGALDGK